MHDHPVILYVEDDPQSQTVLEILLKDMMQLAHVTILGNSTDFRAQLEAIAPRADLILLDIHVKPINGFEMLKIARSMDYYQKIPIAALTASVMNEEVETLRTAGFDGCLPKPVSVATFPKLISRLLAGEKIWEIH